MGDGECGVRGGEWGGRGWGMRGRVGNGVGNGEWEDCEAEMYNKS